MCLSWISVPGIGSIYTPLAENQARKLVSSRWWAMEMIVFFIYNERKLIWRWIFFFLISFKAKPISASSSCCVIICFCPHYWLGEFCRLREKVMTGCSWGEEGSCICLRMRAAVQVKGYTNVQYSRPTPAPISSGHVRCCRIETRLSLNRSPPGCERGGQCIGDETVWLLGESAMAAAASCTTIINNEADVLPLFHPETGPSDELAATQFPPWVALISSTSRPFCQPPRWKSFLYLKNRETARRHSRTSLSRAYQLGRMRKEEVNPGTMWWMPSSPNSIPPLSESSFFPPKLFHCLQRGPLCFPIHHSGTHHHRIDSVCTRQLHSLGGVCDGVYRLSSI